MLDNINKCSHATYTKGIVALSYKLFEIQTIDGRDGQNVNLEEINFIRRLGTRTNTLISL
jgi:hypothetical protein